MGRPPALEAPLHRAAAHAWHAPVAVAAGAVALAGFVGAVAPHGQGFYPACPLYTATGIYCPGCGATRAIHALVTGHLATALRDNVLLVIAVPVVALVWWGWMAQTLGRPRPRALDAARLPRWWVPALVAVLAAYAVARNIPSAPFTALAPRP